MCKKRQELTILIRKMSHTNCIVWAIKLHTSGFWSSCKACVRGAQHATMASQLPDEIIAKIARVAKSIMPSGCDIAGGLNRWGQEPATACKSSNAAVKHFACEFEGKIVAAMVATMLLLHSSKCLPFIDVDEGWPSTVERWQKEVIRVFFVTSSYRAATGELGFECDDDASMPVGADKCSVWCAWGGVCAGAKSGWSQIIVAATKIERRQMKSASVIRNSNPLLSHSVGEPKASPSPLPAGDRSELIW